MFENIYLSMYRDIIYKLKVPSEDIWYVQNTLENFDGLALVTNAKMETGFGTFLVYTNSDYRELFINVLAALSSEIKGLVLIGEV